MKIKYTMTGNEDYNIYHTPCPHGKDARVGHPSCHMCQYCKKRDQERKIVICDYQTEPA